MGDNSLYLHIMMTNFAVLICISYNVLTIIIPIDSAVKEAKRFVDLCYKLQEEFIQESKEIEVLTRLITPDLTRSPPGAEPETTRGPPGADLERNRSRPGAEPEPTRNRSGTDREPTRSRARIAPEHTLNRPGAHPEQTRTTHRAHPEPTRSTPGTNPDHTRSRPRAHLNIPGAHSVLTRSTPGADSEHTRSRPEPWVEYHFFLYGSTKNLYKSRRNVTTGPLERSNCRVHLRGRCRDLLTDAVLTPGRFTRTVRPFVQKERSTEKKQPSPLRSGREVGSGRAVSGRRRLFLESWDQTRQKNERGWFWTTQTAHGRRFMMGCSLFDAIRFSLATVALSERFPITREVVTSTDILPANAKHPYFLMMDWSNKIALLRIPTECILTKRLESTRPGQNIAQGEQVFRGKEALQ
ncbi:hypothetical protein GEV33_003842 [Tenebrio molitor]|uniref:Uncharacterized protein n=1 Tax=Tenebrio molitor TaxID=7067 RepID=A0A8J6LDY0_TENMO|nr:hypothetical protein GEV33_003842 [Tenebrio molitor]